MKPTQSPGVCPLPPPVEAPLQLNNRQEAIVVEFTDERLSAHAGSAGFWSWLRGTGVIAELERLQPHSLPVFHNHLTPLTGRNRHPLRQPRSVAAGCSQPRWRARYWGAWRAARVGDTPHIHLSSFGRFQGQEADGTLLWHRFGDASLKFLALGRLVPVVARICFGCVIVAHG